MDPIKPSIDLEIKELLANTHQRTLPELRFLAYDLLPSDTLPHAYLDSLSDLHATIALKACLLVYFSSQRRVVPRQFQLEASIALSDGRDVVVDSGTGSGKTLCQIIPNLLYPNTTSVTVSPLKRLQIVQAAEFERWGVKTVCINEDTPNDPELWNTIRNGGFQHLIVQPEQLKMFQGHLPRLARILSIPQFAKTIARVHIDEVHNHVLAGLPHYGLPAFRPAWGSLNEFRLRLPKGVPFQALSGTLPPHIKTAVVDHLNFNPTKFLSLKLCSNRPNIIYATHRIVGSLSDFHNLNFLVGNPFTFVRKVIVFHDDTHQCTDAASYVDKLLPVHLQNSGLVRHYHGGMSKDYLTKVFDDFSDPNGTCKILHATEGASTGLDVPDIDAVIDYGCPQKKPTSQQRAGRAGRRGKVAVYLVMAEPWVYTASLDAVDPNGTDPDRPISGRLVKDAKKPQRAGLAMILYVRSTVCLREMIRRYLADNSPEALVISTEWCCDLNHPGHPSKKFDKRTFFPGRFIYSGDNDRVWLNPPKGKKRKAKGLPNRKVSDRDELEHRLQLWLETAHSSDPLRSVRPPTFILPPKSIKALATVHPTRIQSIAQVVSTIQETQEWEEEWGDKVSP
ncbi:P-loop containing nucleoside triphosphate hydrolase protein [Mycena olivaceomarginata]|nr:P-loop containing nucleoside triphosphate hydrolase protein [Mycena olivaceomarginata]